MNVPKVYNVLFLCTGNSARSIMAEAILNAQSAGRFRGFSAGSHAVGTVNPRAIELLQRNHYKTETLRSKSWDEFAAPDAPVMDFVFTVCDQAAAEVCPVWPGQPISAYWGVADPAAATAREPACHALSARTVKAPRAMSSAGGSAAWVIRVVAGRGV